MYKGGKNKNLKSVRDSVEKDNNKNKNFGNPKKKDVEKDNNLIPGLYRSTTHYDSSNKVNNYCNND